MCSLRSTCYRKWRTRTSFWGNKLLSSKLKFIRAINNYPTAKQFAILAAKKNKLFKMIRKLATPKFNIPPFTLANLCRRKVAVWIYTQKYHKTNLTEKLKPRSNKTLQNIRNREWEMWSSSSSRRTFKSKETWPAQAFWNRTEEWKINSNNQLNLSRKYTYTKTSRTTTVRFAIKLYAKTAL